MQRNSHMPYWILFIDVVGLRMLLTLLGGASLRHLETGDIIGNSPFMDSLIMMIMLLFLISGICFEVGPIIATMIPHIVILFITWIALLVVWYLFGLPLGPGAQGRQFTLDNVFLL